MGESVRAGQAGSGAEAGRRPAYVRLAACAEPRGVGISDTADLLGLIDRLYAAAIEAPDHPAFMDIIAACLGVHRAEVRPAAGPECCRAQDGRAEVGEVRERGLFPGAVDAALGPLASTHEVSLGFLLHDGTPVALDLFGDMVASEADPARAARIDLMLPHVKRAIQVRVAMQGPSPLDADEAEGDGLADAPQGEAAFIEQHFGLPPSQARLMALLYQGHSIKSAAMNLRITEGSARQYLKRIFEKTGARRQVDLVRLAARVLTYGGAAD